MNIDDIRRFIQIELLDDETIGIEDDTDLLLAGILDSHSVMRVAAYIEDLQGVTIPPEDVTTDNFSSLRQIGSYVAARVE